MHSFSFATLAYLDKADGWDDSVEAARANQTASINKSLFGRPGRCLTSRALTSHGSSPWASNR